MYYRYEKLVCVSGEGHFHQRRLDLKFKKGSLAKINVCILIHQLLVHILQFLKLLGSEPFVFSKMLIMITRQIIQ